MKKFLSVFLTVLLACAIMTVAVVATQTGVTQDAQGIYCTNLLDFNKETNDLWARYNEGTGKWECLLKAGDYEWQYKEPALDASGNLVYKKDDKGEPIYVTDINGNPVLDENGQKIQQYETIATKPIAPVVHPYSSYSAHKWSLIEDGEVFRFESTDSSIYPGIAFEIDMNHDNVFPIGLESSDPKKAEYVKVRIRNHSACDQMTFGFVTPSTNNGKFVQATVTELTEDVTEKKYASSGEWATYTFSMHTVNMNTNYSDLIYDPTDENAKPGSRWGSYLHEFIIFPFGYDVTDGSGNYPGAAMDIDYIVIGSRAYVDSYQSALEQKEASIKSLELVKAPTKTKYYVGEALNLEGLELKATYNDGSEETLNTASASVSTFFDVVNTVELKFGKEKVSFTVDVVDIANIEVNKTPEDTVYEVEELADGFVSDGFQIKVNYADGTHKISDIAPSAENGAQLSNSSFKFAGDFTTAGTQTVTVHYLGKSVTFDITTIQVTDIEFTATKEYRYNSKPKIDDFDINLVFSNDSKVASKDAEIAFTYTLECDVKAPGTVKAKITATNTDYNLTFTKEVDVTVETPTDIEVTKAPNKTEYNPNETFDPKGMTVSFVYADGKKVTVNSADYTTRVSTNSPGTKSVAIRSEVPGLKELFNEIKPKTTITVLGDVGGEDQTSNTTTTPPAGGNSGDNGWVLPVIIVAAVLVVGAVVVVVIVAVKKKKQNS